MPQPRRLSPKQEQDAYARYAAAKGARGAVAMLASDYGLTWPGMKCVLDRVERETKSNVPRETLNLELLQP